MSDSPDINDLRRDLRNQILEAYRDEYKELCFNRQNLDVKAQGNVAIAGIFLAGIFVFIRDVGKFSCFEKVLLITLIVCLVASVLLSILALIVRKITDANLGNNIKALVERILEESDFEKLKEASAQSPTDQKNLWEKLTPDIRKINTEKGWYLLIGQILLLAAITAAVVVLILRITAA